MAAVASAGTALVGTASGRLMLLVCLVLGGAMMSGGFGELSSLGGSGRGVTVQEQADHVLIRWSGPVDKRMTRALNDAFRQRLSDRRRIVLSLHSDGGLVSEGKDIIERIQRLRRTHTVDTLVEKGRHCASMCVPIFATGGHRMAHPDARFMFHSVRLAATSGSFRSSREAVREIEERATESLFDDHLRASGISERWLESLRTTMGRSDIWLSGRELHDMRVGVVDELAAAGGR